MIFVHDVLLTLNGLVAVMDINRIAAVIQAVVKDGDTIFGERTLLSSYSEILTVASCERLEEERHCGGLLTGPHVTAAHDSVAYYYRHIWYFSS